MQCDIIALFLSYLVCLFHWCWIEKGGDLCVLPHDRLHGKSQYTLVYTYIFYMFYVTKQDNMCIQTFSTLPGSSPSPLLPVVLLLC